MYRELTCNMYVAYVLNGAAAVVEIEMLCVSFFIFRRFPNFIEYFSHMNTLASSHKPTCMHFELADYGLFFLLSFYFYCAVHTESRRCCWLLLVACCLAIHRISSWFAYTHDSEPAGKCITSQYYLRPYHLLFASPLIWNGPDDVCNSGGIASQKDCMRQFSLLLRLCLFLVFFWIWIGASCEPRIGFWIWLLLLFYCTSRLVYTHFSSQFGVLTSGLHCWIWLVLVSSCTVEADEVLQSE